VSVGMILVATGAEEHRRDAMIPVDCARDPPVSDAPPAIISMRAPGVDDFSARLSGSRVVQKHPRSSPIYREQRGLTVFRSQSIVVDVEGLPDPVDANIGSRRSLRTGAANRCRRTRRRGAATSQNDRREGHFPRKHFEQRLTSGMPHPGRTLPTCSDCGPALRCTA